MKFLLKFGMDRQRQSLKRSMWQISLSTLGAMILFEFVKQMTLHRYLTVWQSQALTIVFVTLTATVIGFFELSILHATNRQMALEVIERKRAEQEFRELNALLDQRVIERTAQFEAGNLVLEKEIADRQCAEQALYKAHEKLSHSLAAMDQRNKEMAQLNDMTDLLQACQSKEEVYKIIARTAERLFPSVSGAVAVISSSRNLLETVAVWGPLRDSSAEPFFAPFDCWGLRRSSMHIVEHPDPTKCCRHLVPASSGIDICIPLMAQGDALGVLHLRATPPLAAAHQGAPEQSAATLQRLLNAMAKDVSIALANLRLRDSLRNQSIRDPLTGLFNRRYMEETLEMELHRALRGRRPLAVIMLDLDHFKHFNDTFGHAAGDTVLREMGSFLQSQIRAGDIACRYGGEEFALILMEATLEVASDRAGSLVCNVKQLALQHSGQPLGKITLSAGVAVFPEAGATQLELLAAADKALYAAKAAGRDRVVLAETPGMLSPSCSPGPWQPIS